jgi:hypothetical protein
MVFLQGTDGNDVLGGTRLDDQLLGPGATTGFLALAAATTSLVISCQIPVLPFLTPLEPIACGHDFLSRGSNQRWSLVFVSDALAPGVSPLAESREQGGAIYAVG